MRFYEAEAFGDEAGRHELLAISDLDVDNPIPPYICIGNFVLVPEEEVEGRGERVFDNTTAQQLLNDNLDQILGEIPILIHEPDTGRWKVHFGAEEVASLRIAQVKSDFFRTITARFPEWKQLNIDADERRAIQWLSDWTGIPALDIYTWLFNKLWPLDAPWHELVRRPAQVKTMPLDALVDETMDFIAKHRSDAIGYIPDRALVEQRIREAAYGLGVRNAINALRDQCTYLESEIKKLTKIDDIVHFNVPPVWW
jgi:hypothetical protein